VKLVSPNIRPRLPSIGIQSEYHLMKQKFFRPEYSSLDISNAPRGHNTFLSGEGKPHMQRLSYTRKALAQPLLTTHKVASRSPRFSLYF